MPGILLIFYPMTFGIQNDLDAGILEILFGIPDYRYKVWLVRLILIFVLVFLMMIGLTVMSYFLLAPVNIFELSFQVMFPIYFLGSMAFLFSTVIKNGNGTAVVMVIIGVLLLIISGALERTMWNIFLNPFNIPNRLNEMVWQEITMKNRIFLSVGSLLFVLYGLFNLQKREKFI
jgi:ABC-type transport system involved in multi-copper enzyme maturation permease subunit